MTQAVGSDANLIAEARAWVETVVVGFNFCPFAGRELQRDSIRYRVIRERGVEPGLHALIEECIHLDEHPETETTLLIYPATFSAFDEFLDFLAIAEALLTEQGYEGLYQLASFHPGYRFAGSAADDAANYTNRSPAPMLHLIREASMEQALRDYPSTAAIPARNIARARAEGREKLQARLAACRQPRQETDD